MASNPLSRKERLNPLYSIRNTTLNLSYIILPHRYFSNLKITTKPRLLKSGFYIRSWEVGGIIDRKIRSWIVRFYIIWEKKKKQISMLNNHINYAFIKNRKFASIWCNYHTSLHPFVTIILKRSKISKCNTLLGCYFSFGSTNTLSLYVRIAKLSLLGYYFSFGSNWVFCQVKEDYKKPGSFGIVRILRSWTIAKILERSRSFWAGRIVKS